MRNAFMQTIAQLASEDSHVMFLTGDLGFGMVESFARQFPKQFVNVGVAEQNMIGIAAGLALSGKKVIVYSIGNFPTLRCFEQIRNDICYHKLPVVVAMGGGGFAYGALGSTHHATEDVAVMRALPEMTVVVPADPFEVALATRAAIALGAPCYLRMNRVGESSIYHAPPLFFIGKAITLRHGNDATIIGTGAIIAEALEASRLLLSRGVSSRVLSMHTIKPIDREAIIRAAQETRVLITVEEHMITGGLGGAVAEVLASQENTTRYFQRMGIPDTFASVVGSQQFLRSHYGLTAEKIAETVENLMMRN